jgi:hypothetical protein
MSVWITHGPRFFRKAFTISGIFTIIIAVLLRLLIVIGFLTVQLRGGCMEFQISRRMQGAMQILFAAVPLFFFWLGIKLRILHVRGLMGTEEYSRDLEDIFLGIAVWAVVAGGYFVLRGFRKILEVGPAVTVLAGIGEIEQLN